MHLCRQPHVCFAIFNSSNRDEPHFQSFSWHIVYSIILLFLFCSNQWASFSTGIMQYAILIDFGTSSRNIIISLPLWSMVKVRSSILVSFSTTTTDSWAAAQRKETWTDGTERSCTCWCLISHIIILCIGTYFSISNKRAHDRFPCYSQTST